MTQPWRVLWLIGFWWGTGLAGEMLLNEFPPKGLDCLTGNDSVGDSGFVEHCYIAPNGHVLTRRSAQSEGYRVSMEPIHAPPSACVELDNDVHNCINVLPGRSRTYVEAAVGLNMPDDRNVFHWRGKPSRSEDFNYLPMTATFIFEDELLVTLEVSTALRSEGGSPP